MRDPTGSAGARRGVGVVAGASRCSRSRRYGRRFWQFILDSRVELRKVVWPSRAGDLQDHRWWCSASSSSPALFFWLLDLLLAWATRLADGAGRLIVALRWYVVHAYSNFEHRVAESLKERIKRDGLEAAVRRDPGADRGSGGDARRPEAQERAQVLPRLRAGADGDGRADLAPGARRAQGARVHRRHAATSRRRSPRRKRTRSCAASRKASTSRGRRCCSSPARWCA